MTEVLHPDELFNEEARLADPDTPVDRFHDLILAVFQSNVREAYQLYLDHPNREPNIGLVQNAAAWIQELIMPDMTQQDIAEKISRWIVKEAEVNNSLQRVEVVKAQTNQTGYLQFM